MISIIFKKSHSRMAVAMLLPNEQTKVKHNSSPQWDLCRKLVLFVFLTSTQPNYKLLQLPKKHISTSALLSPQIFAAMT